MKVFKNKYCNFNGTKKINDRNKWLKKESDTIIKKYHEWFKKFYLEHISILDFKLCPLILSNKFHKIFKI